MLCKYQHHIVRDLAWAISSPPLLIPEEPSCRWFDNEWYMDLYASSLNWLQRLDESPELLQERLDNQKDRRLGRYFETLWAFWLDQSPRFDVIEHNLPFRDDGKTLGELDFLLLDKQSGQYLHWELAVKFYLGMGDTRNHANWHGPGKKDRLDLKVEHLSNRQSVICQRPMVQRLLQGMGYRVDDCGIILKGRLFYPYANRDKAAAPADANPHHLKSYWISISDLLKSHEHHREYPCLSPLIGYGWMASAEQAPRSPLLSIDELEKALKNAEYRLPLYVSREKQSGVNERIFIVPDSWEDD